MKKSALLVFGLLFICTHFIKAQNCTPDPSISPELTGVHPMPYDKSTNPDGGIKDTICLGKPFSFTFTTIVGDSFSLGALRIPLDSLVMNTSGSVTNLPKGISYACYPNNCSFKKESQGCVIIQGTVTDAALVGNHKLSIKGKLYGNGSPTPIDLVFPSPLIAPGEYILSIADENNSPCRASSIGDDIRKQVAVFPNPTTTYINIETGLKVMKIEILNLSGQVELISNHQNLINTSALTKGFYICKITTENGIINLPLSKY